MQKDGNLRRNNAGEITERKNKYAINIPQLVQFSIFFIGNGKCIFKIMRLKANYSSQQKCIRHGKRQQSDLSLDRNRK